MSTNDNPSCVFCKSSKVIKHGKTSTGNPRYRCRSCGKTWVLDKHEPIRPEIVDIAEAYLNGRTCRDLVKIYHSSPLRINQKIREFLEGVPHWEEYIDSCSSKCTPRLVVLTGKTFSCSCPKTGENSMFLAFAIDALSTVIIGYEIASVNSPAVWIRLLNRLKEREFDCPSFMTNGSRCMQDCINEVYPDSQIRISYHKTYRDKEINCCLSRLPMNNKLINDAIKIYNTLDNKCLESYLKSHKEKRIQEVLVRSQEEFIKRLKERFTQKHTNRIEGLNNAFQSRFEKFHMLKDDPYPVINGWISHSMLQRLDVGFSRLSLYMQIPTSTSFKNFACGNMPVTLNLREDSPLMKSFVIEIAARGLQMPILYSKCEMKLDKCSLF